MEILFYILSFCFSQFILFMAQNFYGNVVRHCPFFNRVRKNWKSSKRGFKAILGIQLGMNSGLSQYWTPGWAENTEQWVTESCGPDLWFAVEVWSIWPMCGKLAISQTILLRKALERPIASAHRASKSVVSRNDVRYPLAKGGCALCVWSGGSCQDHLHAQ